MKTGFHLLTKHLLIVYLLLTCTFLHAQVTVGSGYPANPNALLELRQNLDNSSDKGFLLPRVTLTGVTSPAPMTDFVPGMVVYNTAFAGLLSDAVTPGFYYCDGGKWVRLNPAEEVIIPTEPWKDAATGNDATLNTQSIYQNAPIAIGKEGGAHPSAQLEVASNNSGILIPRLDQKQRDGIANPTQSLLIWNTDEDCFNFWKNGKWKSMCGDIGETVIRITPVDCNAATVVGDYKVGMPTNSSNYIQLTMQVIEPGTYIIEGQTGKGFFFQRSGSFTATGAYTIQIPAIGMPNEGGVLSFPLTLNGVPFDPICLKEVTVEAADVKFTFDPTYCATNAYSEDLTRGESSTGKTTKIKVDVHNAGIFNFSTNTVNGIQYTANNVNLAVGSHEVTLIANGNAPTAAGSHVAFTVTGTGMENTPCEILVNILEKNATVVPDCNSAKVIGTYRLDVATTTANYIEIAINFTDLGTWSGTATNAEAGFSFTGNGVVNATGVQTVRLYASGTPIDAGAKDFAILINGVACNTKVNIMMPTKNVLYIGGGFGNVLAALRNTSNFGPTGKSKVENIKLVNGGNPYNDAATLINLINNNDIEIILAGWSFDCSDQVASVIADFIKNKKGFFFQVEAQDQQPYLKQILDRAYGTNVTFTEDELPIYSTILPNIDNPKLNGVFGDIRGKYVRSDDYASWIGIRPDTQSSPLESLVQLGANGGYSARNTFVYAPGFFMIPDWGMTNYATGTYGTANPIGYNPSAFNGYNAWNGSSYGTANIPIGEMANWVLFGNVMDEAFKYVQDNIVKGYRVKQ